MPRMTKRLWSLLLFGGAWLALGQDSAIIAERTAAPIGGRYELIQSSRMARLTFKLDKFTGRVWELVEARDGELKWQEMIVRGVAEGARSNTAPRFQIFLSGRLAKDSFLLDSLTGVVWVYTELSDPDTKESTGRVWARMAVIPSS